jgi:hypothetical protein
MPNRRLIRIEGGPPVIGAIGRAAAIVVNFVASIPGAVRAFSAGTLNSRVPATLLIALGGFVPGVTSGLNRFGVTWSFFLGELLGIVFIFAGFLVSIEVFSDIRLPFTRIVLARRNQPEPPGASPARSARSGRSHSRRSWYDPRADGRKGSHEQRSPFHSSEACSNRQRPPLGRSLARPPGPAVIAASW